jgi:catechol 2,3-dioxygenase-like lactoylglutathione lyase family enzyme
VKGRLGRKMAKEKFVSKGIFGIHHVIAITSDPQRNIDFYANRRWIIYRLVSAGVILEIFTYFFYTLCGNS